MKNEQYKLEQELDFIMGQQSYLEQSIKKLETGIEQMPSITKQYGDEERVQTYQLLLTIDNQLRTMSTDLKDIIKRLNATNVNLNDPVSLQFCLVFFYWIFILRLFKSAKF